MAEQAWEGAYGRSLSGDERSALREREETWQRAKRLGLVTAQIALCPQCGGVLEMPSDAVTAICGMCTAYIRRHGSSGVWETAG